MFIVFYPDNELGDSQFVSHCRVSDFVFVY